MRNHSKKLLSFLLAVLVLLGTMPVAFTAFAEDNSPKLVLNGGTLTNPSAQINAGDLLPTYSSIYQDGLTFGGWFTSADFSGAQSFKAEANTTYYARWVIHTVNAVDFEDVTTSNFSTKFRTYLANGGSVSLNTDGINVHSGKNSVFIQNTWNYYANPKSIDFGTKDTNNLWWDSLDDVKDGYCFWISVDREVTFEYQNQWNTIATITVPYGKHMITIPRTNAGFLYDSKFVIHGGNVAKIYIDDIGTFEDWSLFETNGGTWAEGYTAPSKVVAGDKLPTYENITRDGLTFAGWYTTADFSSERLYYAPESVSGLQSYYAHRKQS